MGVVTFDDSIPLDPGSVEDLERPGGQDTSPPPIPGRLKGRALTAGGFTDPVDLAVTVERACSIHWCLPVASGGTWLVFAREDPGGLVVEFGTCLPFAVQDPTPDDLATVAACARRGACPAP